jgi:hypothetical protein
MDTAAHQPSSRATLTARRRQTKADMPNDHDALAEASGSDAERSRRLAEEAREVRDQDRQALNRATFVTCPICAFLDITTIGERPAPHGLSWQGFLA